MLYCGCIDFSCNYNVVTQRKEANEKRGKSPKHGTHFVQADEAKNVAFQTFSISCQRITMWQEPFRNIRSIALELSAKDICLSILKQICRRLELVQTVKVSNN